jgi:hypothetical protein
VYYKIGLTASFDYLGFEGSQSCPYSAQLHWQHMVWQVPMPFHLDSRVIESFQNAIEQKNCRGHWFHLKMPAWDYFPLYQPLLLSGFALHHLLLTAG